MKQVTIKSAILCAALVVGTAAHAATYTAHYDYVGKFALSSAQQDSQLDADTVACDGGFGVQAAMPSAAYRRCMLQHGWRYSYLTRDRAVADPSFNSSVRLAPGHFIDHDNGMDCQNMGGAEVCTPPNGTVHYYDPEQGLNCTRTGFASICSNF
jgi:hypothetical protein